MRTIKTISQLLLILSVLMTAGCANQKAWVYRANSYPPAPGSSGKKIAVLAYDDARENKNSNAVMMYMIPLMPVGWQDLSAPEGTQMHITSGMWLNYKPTEDYPKALAEDLRKTGVFADAYFTFRKEDSDYAVTGKILSTKYKGCVISYGLSVYGPLLWLIGFPAASTSNDLSVELTLTDTKIEKALLTKVYHATPRKDISWLYVMKDDFNYAEMLAEVNKQFCLDIQPILNNQGRQ